MKRNRMDLPPEGRPLEELRREMEERKRSDADWRGGRTFSLVYPAGEDVDEVLRAANDLYVFENALNPQRFPSLKVMERDVVGMTLGLLHGPDDAGGCMTSGGTESILMAVKTARNRAREERGITAPEMVVPISAHPAFAKAAELLGIEVHLAPLAPDLRVDVAAVARAVNVEKLQKKLGPKFSDLGGGDPSEHEKLVDEMTTPTEEDITKVLEEEVTRQLTANNPNAPSNIARYSSKERVFSFEPVVDQLVMHFAMDGFLIHQDSDDAKRQIYDRYGEQGVQAIDQATSMGVPQWILLSPAVQGGLFCMLIMVVVLIFVMLPILLLCRIDGAIDWSWGVVLAPLWIVNAAIVLIIASAIRHVEEGETPTCASRCRRVPVRFCLVFGLTLRRFEVGCRGRCGLAGGGLDGRPAAAAGFGADHAVAAGRCGTDRPARAVRSVGSGIVTLLGPAVGSGRAIGGRTKNTITALGYYTSRQAGRVVGVAWPVVAFFVAVGDVVTAARILAVQPTGIRRCVRVR